MIMDKEERRDNPGEHKEETHKTSIISAVRFAKARVPL
jgi:hypothetical protein